MERHSNQVLRQFGENARKASKENQPPQLKILYPPFSFDKRNSNAKAIPEHTTADGNSKAPSLTTISETDSDRHVTFSDPVPQGGLGTIHPAFRPRQRPPPGRARASTPLDLKIGSAEADECLPQRLRVSKNNPVVLEKRLEELIRENGYLQQELLYHKDTLAVMNAFYESTRRAHHDLQNALAETARKVAISEQRLLDCYGRQPFSEGSEDNVF